MNLEQETKFILKKYHICANKNYGQNFLIDQTIVDSIVKTATISKKDCILEIGPGLGTLTSSLLEKAGKVICIELDPKMVTILKDRFALYDNFELLHDDILKVDLHTILKEHSKNYSSFKVVANLPYYITTPIIMKLLEEKLPFQTITVMVQKEVAERLTQTPGNKNSGSITYTIHYYTQPSLVIDVPRTCFLPSPKVDSAVISLKILNTPPISPLDETLFFKLIKLAFLQKRKTLVNAFLLGNLGSRDFLEKMLSELCIDVKIRGEKLSLEQFQAIADYFYHHQNDD